MCAEGEGCLGRLGSWTGQAQRRGGTSRPHPGRRLLECVTCHPHERPPVWQVLRQYSINLSEEEFFHILEYYDKTLSSRISYNDFLRAFLQ